MKSAIKYAILFKLISLIAISQQSLADATASTLANATKNSLHRAKPKESLTKASISRKMKVHAQKLGVAEFKPYILKNVVIKADAEMKLDPLAAEYIGKQFTYNDLQALNKKILQLYANQDYLIPLVHYERVGAKQDVLQITTKAVSISDVTIYGDGADDKLIQQYAKKMLTSTPASIKKTQRYLALINKVVGYDMSYKLKAKQSNANPPFNEEMDLMIFTSDKKKLGVYVDSDNNINKDFGNAEFVGLVQINSPFKTGESFAINALTSDKPNRLYGYGLNYRQPINAEGTNLDLYASHAQDNASNGYSGDLPNNKLSSVKLAIAHQLLLEHNKDLEIEAGTQYWNAVGYNNASALPDNKSYSDNFWTVNAGMKYVTTDSLKGKNLANIIFSTNLGGSHSNYVNLSDVPSKNFGVVQANHYREQPLVNNFSFYSHLSGIYSGANIPSQLALTIGGTPFGRGYQPSLITTNQALALSLESRYNYDINHNFVNQIQPYLFVDVSNVNKNNANINISSLSSGGGGVRFLMKNHFNFGAEVAVPFRRNLVINGEPVVASSARFNFFLSKSLDY
jgi:hemolysin activation/secretion protein